MNESSCHSNCKKQRSVVCSLLWLFAVAVAPAAFWFGRGVVISQRSLKTAAAAAAVAASAIFSLKRIRTERTGLQRPNSV